MNDRAWSDFRSQMPVARNWAYFDHAAVAPLTHDARRALHDWSNDLAENGDVNWPDWAANLEKIRAASARLINGASEEIALIRNTTEGVNLVAEGFPWREGDNVVTLADEFPTNAYPWMNLKARGVEARLVPVENARVDLAKLRAACDTRTRIVSISWVGFSTGWRNDVAAAAEIAHERGAYLFLDAIQALGVFPLDARAAGVDFLAADGHKWLLGPEGAGILWLRREHLELLRPIFVGWNSVKHASDYSRIDLDLRDTAKRYEGGSYNMGALQALGKSLDILMELGAAALSARILEITDDFCERLRSLGASLYTQREGDHRSGIVSFTLPGVDSLSAKKQCLQRGVVLSSRAGKLRVSPHAYNNADDLDALVSALAETKG